MNSHAPRPADARESAAYSNGSRLASIRDMARDYQVSLRALRFYEDRGLLRPLRQGVARYYRAEDRVRLQLILKGKSLGFTLSEIRDLLSATPAPENGDGPAFERVLKPDQIAAQIDHLERQRDDLERAIVALRATHAELAEAGIPSAP